jgi:hypothetical protein
MHLKIKEETTLADISIPIDAKGNKAKYIDNEDGTYSQAVLMPTGTVQNAFAIAPSDDDDLPNPATAIYVGVEGDVKVDLVGTGTGIVFKAMPVGFYPMHATKIYATDTTATDIVGVY